VIFDNAQLRTGLRAIHAQLAPAEAVAIFDLARLGAAADRRTDISEMGILLGLASVVYEMAAMASMPVPGGAIDPNRLPSLGTQLGSPGARELAFACVFLVMIHDRELTTEEAKLAGRLSEALAIAPARANRLALDMESLARAARR
jgi:hypothetical protein